MTTTPPMPPPTTDTETGPAALRRLRDGGRLVAEHPRVAALLARCDGAEVGRAGALLADLDPEEVRAAHPSTPHLEVHLTGSSTLGPLAPFVRGELARLGVLGSVSVGDPGAFALDLMSPGRADLTVCLLDASIVLDLLGDRRWSVDDVEACAAEALALLERLTATHAESGRGTLVLTTAPLRRRDAHHVADLRERARLGAVWRRFTAGVLELGHRDGGAGGTVLVLDLDPLLAESGPAHDPRLTTYAQIAYTDEALAAVARDLAHVGRGLGGRTRKCLVLDLDGTLWGGTLAESGPAGLEMAEGPRGRAHREFQRFVAQLVGQGVLLAVCSKNDAVEVADTLASHPDLLLSPEDFATVVADWAPKARTIEEVSRRLDIGNDSLVLVDDSATETGLVRDHHPGIAVVEVDADDPARHVDTLVADDWFATVAVTDEDRERSHRYRSEARRTEFRESFGSLEDYLAELDTRIELVRAGDGDVARLTQLTLRTNQFTLTTRRRDEAFVAAALADPARLVLPIRVEDRFGAHGLVGVALGRWHEGEIDLEDLAMSCRVLGRGVETAWLTAILRWARDAGAVAVRGVFRPSPRNARVASFYPDHGFVEVGRTPDGTRTYSHDLSQLPEPSPHVEVVSAWEQPAPATTAGGSR